MIAGLVHRYADAVTRGDLDAWAACWADDATWELGADRTAVGRDEIVALYERAVAGLDGVVQHVLHGEADERALSGRWHFQEHFRRTGGEAGLLLAHYEDEYVRHAGGWLFARRVLVPNYQGPPDLSGVFAVHERSTT